MYVFCDVYFNLQSLNMHALSILDKDLTVRLFLLIKLLKLISCNYAILLTQSVLIWM